MKINANVNLTGDLNVEDTSNDSVLTIKDDVNGGTLSIESTANDGNNVQAGTINFDPGESTGSEVAVSITAQSSGTTATNRGGKITIKTKSDNGNLLNRLFIDKDNLETENLLTANINATTVNLQANGTTKFSTTNTYVTATVPVSLPDGSAAAPVITNTGDENTGIYFSTADTVNIATNGIERLNINNSTITAGRNIDMQSTYQINNLPDPTTNQQAATKAYADTKVVGVTQTFTSSGTWTKPAGARKVEVSVLGAGGGGAAVDRQGGGGGGGLSTAIFDASILENTIVVTVGSGGAGALVAGDGSAGGISSFGEYLSVAGGFGGTTAGGNGGSGLLSIYNGANGISGTGTPVIGTCTVYSNASSSVFGGGGGGQKASASVVSDCFLGTSSSLVSIPTVPSSGGCIGTTAGKANNAAVPFYTGSVNGTPADVTFSTDGTKMYTLSTEADTVYQYTLSTAWDIRTVSYASKLFSVTAQENSPTAIFFSSDGTKMYALGTTNDTVYQYTLSTAWDVSTASYASLSFSVTAQEGSPTALFFKSDGLSMYVLGSSSDNVRQYTLSTAWNVSTAVYANKTISISARESTSQGLFFSSDGTKMYVTGNTNKRIDQYTLSTAWDVSTATYASKTYSMSTLLGTSVNGVTASSDGTKFYVCGASSTGNFVLTYQLNLSTSWDIATAAYTNPAGGAGSYRCGGGGGLIAVASGSPATAGGAGGVGGGGGSGLTGGSGGRGEVVVTTYF